MDLPRPLAPPCRRRMRAARRRSTLSTLLAGLVLASLPAAPLAAACGPAQELYRQQSLPELGVGVTITDALPAGDGGPFDSEAADDVTTPANTVWFLTAVEARLLASEPFAVPPDATHLRVYADAAGLPGVEVCSYPGLVPSLVAPPAESGAVSVHLDLPEACTLCAGSRYWVGLSAAGDGHYAWMQLPSRNGRPAVWRNPGGGYGLCPSWAPAAAGCGQGDGASPNLAFALFGRSEVRQAVPGDFNGDRCPDLVFQREAEGPAGRASAGPARIWLMSGTHRLAELPVQPTPAEDLSIAGTDDFNGDGISDLMMISLVEDKYELRLSLPALGPGHVEAVGHEVEAPFNDPLSDYERRIAATGKFRPNTDFAAAGGNIVCQGNGSGQVVIWSNVATQTVYTVTQPGAPVDLNWRIRAAGDLTQDGDGDLVFQNADSGRLVLWPMDGHAPLARLGGGFFLDPVGPASADWRLTGAVDFGVGPHAAGDPGTPLCGSSDLLFQDQLTGQLLLWYMDGSGARSGAGSTVPDGYTLGEERDPSWVLVGPH